MEQQAAEEASQPRRGAFGGIWVPIVTPFRRGVPDLPALARLARQLAASGIRGLVACATTGEGSSLDEAERASVFRTLRETLGRDYPLVMSVAAADTRSALTAARVYAEWQPKALLASPPPYLRPGQDGIRRHFESLAEASDLPLILYDIPYRTGVEIALLTLQALAEDKRIAAIKLCPAGHLPRLEAVIAETPLAVLVGDDGLIFSGLCLGAEGAISAAAHIRPELYVRMQSLIEQGDLPAARHIALALRPVIQRLFADPNPGPVKACLAGRGLIADELRLPLTTAGQSTRQALREAMLALDQACGASSISIAQ